jgi:tetratricopeptide (TPR) repeat protein
MKRAPLPEAPASIQGAVKAWIAPLVLPTYEPAPADRNPMFLEKRVFQGSSGRVYPLPFIDRIADRPVERAWSAVHLENERLRVVVLPELGGRIYAIVDKANGYDLVYRNPVIKPALVGLAGPWASGGIEFNWPQHHRPSTFMPVAVEIEEEADGGRTVWLSEHEPMNRMKGMHGVRLAPGRAAVELRVRLYNRTPLPQTFLWWANAAADVHERYQSFFPRDVAAVADHAKRATSAFPFCADRYYGVDYAGRARDGAPEALTPAQFAPPGDYAANDLRWYANIPVPTSYMCVDSRGDFFGGYDHAADAGVVHVADHHIVVGKKQWTWGNHAFGYAWDRNLTDPDENGVYHPYIELMAGAFTDNQPDFSFLAPGETKAFSEFWYPLRRIGPPTAATADAAVSVSRDGPRVRIGVQVVATAIGGRIEAAVGGEVLASWSRDLDPAAPVVETFDLPEGFAAEDLTVTVRNGEGRALVAHLPMTPKDAEPLKLADEPPPPEAIASADELWVTGVHLDQYRHATRAPDAYWREALRRDPLDARCNVAVGKQHLNRAELADAETCFRRAIERLQRRNPNPYDGEAFYGLGLTLAYRGRVDDAYDAFYKAAWNAAWVSPARVVLAEIDAARGSYEQALAHVEIACRRDADDLRARDLKAICLRRLGRAAEAEACLRETLALDPLDIWARHLSGRPVDGDAQLVLDLALDYARAGERRTALDVLLDYVQRHGPVGAPMPLYHAAAIADGLGRAEEAGRLRKAAAAAPSDYCFPSRIEDVAVLEAAIAADPKDAKATYYLGNLFYDRRRRREAVELWERSVGVDPSFSIAWRNLGIGCFNILGDPGRALDCYDRAHAAAPDDARVFYERDQLWKRVGRTPAERFEELNRRRDLVDRRDDLAIELSSLLNRLGRSLEAAKILSDRIFQPWEGGEGLAVEQWARAHVRLGRRALAAGDAGAAGKLFTTALATPASLGEARHPLANCADVFYWLGCACSLAGDEDSAVRHWRRAAEFEGDFLGMEVRAFSDKTYFSALALRRLGRGGAAKRLLADLGAYADALRAKPAKIDYFATSLPTMLLFDDDLQRRQTIAADVMAAQAAMGTGDIAKARALLGAVLDKDPNCALAAELLDDIGSEGAAVARARRAASPRPPR